MFRLPENPDRIDIAMFPKGVKLIGEGELLALPSLNDFDRSSYRATCIAELHELPPSELAPEVKGTALARYSLRGKAGQFAEQATEPKILFGPICLAGEVTILYAPPNAGKTLITLKELFTAIDEKRIVGGNVYYLNADDSSNGFAVKMQLTDDHGVHTLSPGFNGFVASDLASMLMEMVNAKTAQNTAVIIDTAKKFTDLMDKKRTSEFAQVCRRFAMAGGTILALAHTNKNANASGKQVYAGTADLLQDFDAAYIINPVPGAGLEGETVVCFEAIKRRGGGVERVAYAYANDTNISYEERLASVRNVPLDELEGGVEEYERAMDGSANAKVIDAIRELIEAGTTKKMELAKAAAKRAMVSQRQAMRVLDNYTGDDPERDHWTYSTRDRGAKVFSLLVKPEPVELQEAA